eukprot:Clim_evm20s136 gene=Clim_evmTU20s136
MEEDAGRAGLKRDRSPDSSEDEEEVDRFARRRQEGEIDRGEEKLDTRQPLSNIETTRNSTPGSGHKRRRKLMAGQLFPAFNEKDNPYLATRKGIIKPGKLSRTNAQELFDLYEHIEAVMKRDAGANEEIRKALLACACELPQSVHMYTTVIGLLNTTSPLFVGDFVQEMGQRINRSYEEADMLALKLRFRFMLSLVSVGVISVDGANELVATFLQLVMNENLAQEFRDLMAYIVLSSVPWVAIDVMDENCLQTWLSQIEEYLNGRKKSYLGMISCITRTNDVAQVDYLDNLWAQISQMRQNTWADRVLMRFYQQYKDRWTEKANVHPLPPISLPSPAPERTWPLSQLRFELFKPDDGPEGLPIPEFASIERFLLEEQVRDIIHLYPHHRMEAMQLIENMKPKEPMPLEFTIVECLFGELFRLPHTFSKPVYFSSILVEMCRSRDSPVPAAFSKGVKRMLGQLRDLDIEVTDRLADALSFHLSNFDFRFEWGGLSETIKDEESGGQDLTITIFVRHLLEKCMRLTYKEKLQKAALPVKEMIPADRYFKAALPGDDGVDTIGLGLNPKLFRQLMATVSRRAPADELKQELSTLEIHEGEKPPESNGTALENHSDADKEALLKHLMAAILTNGKKSYSHLISLTEVYLGMIHELWGLNNEANATSAYRLTITEVVGCLWEANTQMITMIMDRYAIYRLVDTESTITWILNRRDTWERPVYWSILDGVLAKLALRRNLVQEKLKEAQEEAVKAPADAENGDHRTSSEMKVEEWQRKHDTAGVDQKVAFTTVFSRMVKKLQELLGENRMSVSAERMALGRLRAIGRKYYRNITALNVPLHSEVFTSDLDDRLQQIYRELSSLPTVTVVYN